MYRVTILHPIRNSIQTRKYYETLEGYQRSLTRLISHKGYYYRIQGHQLTDLVNMQWYTLVDRPADNNYGPPPDNHFT